MERVTGYRIKNTKSCEVYCPHCNKKHIHGLVLGHKNSDCDNLEGYELVEILD
jgi:L-lysine 2,3-aminomutase